VASGWAPVSGTARLEAIIAERKPTERGFECAAAARKGWLSDGVIAPSAVDGLEAIWWRNHDANGRMICRVPAACSCAHCVRVPNTQYPTPVG